MQRTNPASLIVPDPWLVYDFFAAFSRFEYALKRGGFLGGNDKAASADWDGFAKSIKGRFGRPPPAALGDALAYFRAGPPQKQVKEGSGLGWRPIDTSGSEEAFAIRCVKTVRNNLFHGGKFPSGASHDVARSVDLLRHGRVVLDTLVPLDGNVEAFFREAP